MFVTSFPEYARNIQSAINNLLATGEALLIDLQIDARSTLQGFIAGALQFEDGTELHFREFVDVRRSDPRLMYAIIRMGTGISSSAMTMLVTDRHYRKRNTDTRYLALNPATHQLFKRC